MAANNDSKVAPRLRREIMDAIATLEQAATSGRQRAIEEAEKALLAAARSLTGKSREADELWKLIGKTREGAYQAALADRLGDLSSRFGNGQPRRDHNSQPAKPGQVLPSGNLSPFAGTPPEEWQATFERGRQRQISGSVSRRGAPVPGTRKRSASSKKT